MLTNEEFTTFVEDMTKGDLSLRVAGLKVLWKRPSADERVLPYLEPLLHDKTPCLLGIPYIFGEVRWLAAHALAAERKRQGIRQVVRLKNVVKPIDTAGIMRAEYAANIEGQGDIEGLLESLAILRDMGYLPVYDLYLPPPPLPLDQSRQRRAQPVLTYAPAFSGA